MNTHAPNSALDLARSSRDNGTAHSTQGIRRAVTSSALPAAHLAPSCPATAPPPSRFAPTDAQATARGAVTRRAALSVAEAPWSRTFLAYRARCGWGDSIDPTGRLLPLRRHAGLILCRVGRTILGHAIWHASSPGHHVPGLPRSTADAAALAALLPLDCRFFELHEYWVRERWRARGVGRLLFQFAAALAWRRRYAALVLYARHRAAIRICRSAGFREQWLPAAGEILFLLLRPARCEDQ